MVYVATWATFKPKLEKIKRIHHEKNIYVFQKVELFCRKKLNKTFLNFLAPKIYMKLFYTLDKTPSGETGCLSNVYYLLAFQAS